MKIIHVFVFVIYNIAATFSVQSLYLAIFSGLFLLSFLTKYDL